MGRTHMMTHTKREIIKSLLISDYYKLVFLDRGITNSCLVKLNFTGWVSYFWLIFSCLKNIAKHFIKNPSETLVPSLWTNLRHYGLVYVLSVTTLFYCPKKGPQVPSSRTPYKVFANQTDMKIFWKYMDCNIHQNIFL